MKEFYQLLARGKSVLLNKRIYIPSKYIFSTYWEAQDYEPTFRSKCTHMKSTGDFQCLKEKGLSIEIGVIVLYETQTTHQ